MTDDEITELLTEGVALHQQEKFADAIALYDKLLAAHPDNLDALTFLASAERGLGRLQEAVALYDRIAERNPERADFWFNRGNALGEVGRREEALAAYDRSLAIDPNGATALANRGICLAKLDRPDEAIDSYARALAVDPAHRIALNNIANLLSEQGRLHEAADYLRKTIAHYPDLAEAHYNLSHVLLRLGDFANGFREYEWRWDTPDFFSKPGYRDIPVWTGQKLDGKRLIVHSEQGLGDTIQFAKILGLLASLGGDIVFHVPARLDRLFSTLPFPIKVTSAHGASDGDFQVPLISLMHRLKLTFGSIPPAASYLSAEPAEMLRWQDRLVLDRTQPTRRAQPTTGARGMIGSLPTIGLVWQGNPNSPAERGRSLPSPEMLAPFAELDGVRLIALQFLPDEALESAGTPSGWRVKGLSFLMEHPGPDMDRGADAFVDTAAIMASLDLIVSVCTAPLHLAGALGRPTVALLKAVPDWRWLMDRPDTPWYPAMGLVRQGRGEDYTPVIARAVDVARNKFRRRST